MYYVTDESSISFLHLHVFVYKDANFSTLQFSLYQKPLNKYLYIRLWVVSSCKQQEGFY